MRFCYRQDGLLIGCWIGCRFYERGVNEPDADFKKRMEAKATAAEVNGM